MADPANLSPVAGRKPWSWKQKAGMGALCLGAVGGIGWIMSQTADPRVDDPRRPLNADRVGEVGERWSPVPAEPPPMPRVEPASMVRQPPPMPPMPQGMPMAFGAPTRAPARVSITAFEVAGGAPAPSSAGPSPGMPAVESVSQRQQGDALDSKLQQGSDLETATARMLPNRDLFLTMGAEMPCILANSLNTDQPGPFRCVMPAPVLSTSGNVVLMRAGTKLVGAVRESLPRGRKRAFAVIQRIETPEGCIVNLRAPVADQMGEAGIPGEVDNHTWERVRGLAMMALLDTASQATATALANAVASRSNGGVSFNQFSGIGRGAASGFAEDTNIPATLRVPQGTPILVSTMQDLDFRGCFNLRTR